MKKNKPGSIITQT